MRIELTPEQLQKLDRARALMRTNVELTESQREQFRHAIVEERQGRDVNVAKLTKLLTAEAEPGFSGALRRAISHSQRPIAELSAAVAIEPQLLDAFRTGENTLPTDVVDRLADALHLRLVTELA